MSKKNYYNTHIHKKSDKMYWKRFFKRWEIPQIERRESRDLVIERHEHKCSRRSTKIHGNDTNARVEKYSENFYFVVEKNLMISKSSCENIFFTPGPCFVRSGLIFCPRRCRRMNRKRRREGAFDGVRNAKSDRMRRHVC